jgi:hypothetical protein
VFTRYKFWPHSALSNSTSSLLLLLILVLQSVCPSYLFHCGRSVPHCVCRSVGCLYLPLICVPCPVISWLTNNCAAQQTTCLRRTRDSWLQAKVSRTILRRQLTKVSPCDLLKLRVNSATMIRPFRFLREQALTRE